MSNADNPNSVASITIPRHAAAVTPSDSVDLAYPARRLYIGVGGNVTVDLVGGATSVLYKNVGTGQTLPLFVKRVRATGTTATDIVAEW